MNPYNPSPFQLEEAMRQLRIENQRMRDQLDYLTRESSRVVSTIIAIDRKQRTIRFSHQGIHEAIVTDEQLFSRMNLGTPVLLNNQLIAQEVSENIIQTGVLCTVVQVLDTKPYLLLEIEQDGNKRVVTSAVREVKPGDRGLIDFTGYVFIRNFGSKDTSHVLGEEMSVTFDDVIGQEDAKRALIEGLIEPHTKREVYERFGMKPSKGVLLWGPPGTGKTMLGKASANALAKLHGKSAVSSGFIFIKGAELLNKFIGETESNIRKLFAQAREHHVKHGYPAILFFDEADALLGRRGSMHPGFEGIERTIVPQFNAEMDGIRESAAFVLLATNRPDILDPAVIRDGRIDRKVHVARPNEADARSIMRALLNQKPCKGSAADLAAHATRELYSGKHHLWDVTTDKKEVVPIHLHTLASGAMIAGIVERASQRAIREEANHVFGAHLDAAVADVVDEQRRLTHDLNDFMDALDGAIVEVKKVKPSIEEAPKP